MRGPNEDSRTPGAMRSPALKPKLGKVKKKGATKAGLRRTNEPEPPPQREDIFSLIADLKAKQHPGGLQASDTPGLAACATAKERKLASVAKSSALIFGDEAPCAKSGAKDAPAARPNSNIIHKVVKIKQPELVPRDVFDGTAVLRPSREERLVACSELARHMTDGIIPRKQVAEEVARHQGVASLARRFSGLCEDRLGKKWYTHFEAWLLARRTAATAAERLDPCIPGGPSARKDPELSRKLQAAGATREEASTTCDALGKTAASALRGVQNTPTNSVLKVKVENIVVGRDNAEKVKLGCHGVRVEVNRTHYQKLRALFERSNTAMDTTDWKGGRPKVGDFKRRFEEAAFCVLARYSSLQGTHYRGGGFQAIHSECFDVLREDMGVMVECFASPLNCRWSRYCSAFLDTDAPFGSLGSFFELQPEQGSFEANPPFDDDVIFEMCAHMEKLLARAEQHNKPLSFVIIIPQQCDKKGWTSVSESKFLTHHLLLIAGKHGYKEGAQHNRANTHRTACHNTSVFFLQTKAGAKKWPTSKPMLRRLEEAFMTQAAPSKEDEKKIKEATAGPKKNLWGDQDAESDGGESILDHSDENDDDSDKDGSRCESLGDQSEMSDEEMDSEQEEDIAHPKASKKGSARNSNGDSRKAITGSFPRGSKLGLNKKKIGDVLSVKKKSFKQQRRK